MAITISSQPDAMESAYNDNEYVMTTDSTATKIKAKLTYNSVDYILYANKIGTTFTFNFSNILKSFIIDIEPHHGSPTYEYSDYLISYGVVFTEVITGGASTSSISKKVSFNIETRFSLTKENIVDADGSTNLYPVLTDFEYKTIRKGQTVALTWYCDDISSGHIYMILHKKNGTTTNSTILSSITISEKLLSYHFTSLNANYDVLFDSNVLWAEFTIDSYNGYDWLTVGDTKKVKVDSACETSLSIAWLNQYNAIDHYNFKEIQKEGLSRDETGSILDGEFISNMINSNETFIYESFEETEETLQWLRNIWKARKVWVEWLRAVDGVTDVYSYPIEITNDYEIRDESRTIQLSFKMPEEIYD
jgi:hypothetical protein